MFTGHDGPAVMNVYWSVTIFTSDRTSGQVGSSLPDYRDGCNITSVKKKAILPYSSFRIVIISLSL